MSDDLREVKIGIVEDEQFSLKQLDEWIDKHINKQNAWLLAESPRKVIFEQIAEKLPCLEECASIIIFNENAEIRIEKKPGAKEGFARTICEGETGEGMLARKQLYILRDEKLGKLRHIEYFKEDEYGFPQKYCDRLAGVVKGGE